jgi:glycosyltransferase involved in cell wall biosynthesis
MQVVIDASAVHETSGGAGTYLRALVCALPSVGIDPIVITRKDDQTPWTGAAELLAVAPTSRPLRLAWEQTGLVRAVVGLRRGNKALVLHSPHYTMPRFVPSFVARVVTIHDLTFFSRPQDHDRSKRILFTNAITHAATRADALVCVSQATERALRTFVPVSSPVVVAPHGVDLSLFRTTAELSENERVEDARLLASVGVRPPYVLHHGTIEPRKRVDLVISAVEMLAYPELQLVLSGQMWASFEASFLPPKPFERRLGFVSEELTRALLRNAVTVVYPSAEEGFGLPVLEALASGTPVITTANSAMSEVAGESALYVPGESRATASDIARRLEEVLSTSQLPIAVSSLPAWTDPVRRKRRVQTFSWAESARQHIRAYELALRL